MNTTQAHHIKKYGAITITLGFLACGAITANAYETADLIKGCSAKYAGYDEAIKVCTLYAEHGEQIVHEKWGGNDIELKCATFAAAQVRAIIAEDEARKEKLEQAEKTMGKSFGIKIRAMQLWAKMNYPAEYTANAKGEDKTHWINRMLQPGKAVGLCKRIAGMAAQRFSAE